MKVKNVFLVVFAFLALSPTLVGAEEHIARNAISVELIGTSMFVVAAFMGSPMYAIPVNIQYQRVISKHTVLFLGARMAYSWPRPDLQPDSPVISEMYGRDGWMLSASPIVELDWHPSQEGLNGFYAGACGMLGFTAWHRDTAGIKGTSYQYDPYLGLTAGWQFLLPANLIIDLAWGYGGGYFVMYDENGVMTSQLRFTSGRIGVSLGFRF